MTYTFIAEACSDLPISTCCAVLGVSTSGFYQRRNLPVTTSELDEAYLANTIVDIHTMSRRSYGSPRVHAELRLAMGERHIPWEVDGAGMMVGWSVVCVCGWWCGG